MKPLCKKCQAELTGKQTSYCSKRCSKLHLKALAKKRNKDKHNAYNRAYRAKGIATLGTKRKADIIASFGSKCMRCDSTENLNVHHFKPLRFGGTHRTIAVLCFPCHMNLEQRMKGYWENTDQKKTTS